jgi:hypothetical protein
LRERQRESYLSFLRSLHRTASRWRLREPVYPTLHNMFEVSCRSMVKFADIVDGVLLLPNVRQSSQVNKKDVCLVRK